jgi:hypothetical protein
MNNLFKEELLHTDSLALGLLILSKFIVDVQSPGKVSF